MSPTRANAQLQLAVAAVVLHNLCRARSSRWLSLLLCRARSSRWLSLLSWPAASGGCRPNSLSLLSLAHFGSRQSIFVKKSNTSPNAHLFHSARSITITLCKYLTVSLSFNHFISRLFPKPSASVLGELLLKNLCPPSEGVLPNTDPPQADTARKGGERGF